LWVWEAFSAQDGGGLDRVRYCGVAFYGSEVWPIYSGRVVLPPVSLRLHTATGVEGCSYVFHVVEQKRIVDPPIPSSVALAKETDVFGGSGLRVRFAAHGNVPPQPVRHLWIGWAATRIRVTVRPAAISLTSS